MEKQYTAEELMAADTLVPSLVGMGLSDATAALQKANLDVRTVGDGETVTAQIPAQGASIPGGSKVVLYMGEQPSTELVEVPDLTGKTPAQAKSALSELGLYMKLSGDTGADSKAVTQTVAAGTQVPEGTVVEVNVVAGTLKVRSNVESLAPRIYKRDECVYIRGGKRVPKAPDPSDR